MAEGLIDSGYHRLTQFIWNDSDKFRSGSRVTPTVSVTGSRILERAGGTGELTVQVDALLFIFFVNEKGRAYGLVWLLRGLTPQQKPGAYRGRKMMMKCECHWWRKPEYPEETTGIQRRNWNSKRIKGRSVLVFSHGCCAALPLRK